MKELKNMKNNIVLEATNINSWYNINENVLNNIDFSLEKGKIVALLGVNGSGKTTLINTIVGIHKNFRGSIKINNDNKINSTKVKRDRFFISDTPMIFIHMTAMEYIKFLHLIYKKKIDIKRLNELIELFEFSKYIDVNNDELSLGNKQKVLLIVAFMLNCPLLILDEPLVGLDVLAIENFYNEVKKYVSKGNTVLLSTHLIELVENVCDQAIIIDKSKIVDKFNCEDINIKSHFFEVISNE